MTKQDIKNEYMDAVNRGRLMMFEIEEGGEYYTYDIKINDTELYCHGYSHGDKLEYLAVELEEDCTLDYHLEGLYEICYMNAYGYHQQLLKGGATC